MKCSLFLGGKQPANKSTFCPSQRLASNRSPESVTPAPPSLSLSTKGGRYRHYARSIALPRPVQLPCAPHQDQHEGRALQEQRVDNQKHCTCHLYIMPLCHLTGPRLCQIALRHAMSDLQRVGQLQSAHSSMGNCHMSLLSEHPGSAFCNHRRSRLYMQHAHIRSKARQHLSLPPFPALQFLAVMREIVHIQGEPPAVFQHCPCHRP